MITAFTGNQTIFLKVTRTIKILPRRTYRYQTDRCIGTVVALTWYQFPDWLRPIASPQPTPSGRQCLSIRAHHYRRVIAVDISSAALYRRKYSEQRPFAVESCSRNGLAAVTYPYRRTDLVFQALAFVLISTNPNV